MAMQKWYVLYFIGYCVIGYPLASYLDYLVEASFIGFVVTYISSVSISSQEALTRSHIKTFLLCLWWWSNRHVNYFASFLLCVSYLCRVRKYFSKSCILSMKKPWKFTKLHLLEKNRGCFFPKEMIYDFPNIILSIWTRMVHHIYSLLRTI